MVEGQEGQGFLGAEVEVDSMMMMVSKSLPHHTTLFMSGGHFFNHMILTGLRQRSPTTIHSQSTAQIIIWHNRQFNSTGLAAGILDGSRGRGGRSLLGWQQESNCADGSPGREFTLGYRRTKW